MTEERGQGVQSESERALEEVMRSGRDLRQGLRVQSPGRGSSQCKGPEEENVLYSRNRKKPLWLGYNAGKRGTSLVMLRDLES